MHGGDLADGGEERVDIAACVELAKADAPLPCIARMRVCLDSRPSPQGTQTTGTPRKRPSSGCVVSDELSSERTAYSGSQGPT